MKKILAILLSLALVLSLAACGGESPSSGNGGGSGGGGGSAGGGGSSVGDGDRTLVIGISSDPKGVHLGAGGGMNGGKLMTYPFVWQYPVCLIADMETGEATLYYTLIESFEQIDDRTVEVYIREGIHDNLGNPITASDFVYSIDYNIGQGGSPQLMALEGVEYVDDTTFQMKWKDIPNANDIEDCLAVPCIFSQAAHEANPEGFIYGTTPWTLEEYVEGSHLRFVKSEVGYWNAAANESKSVEDGYCPQYDDSDLDVVEFKIITDTATMALALEAGDIDMYYEADGNDAKMFASTGNYNVDTSPSDLFTLVFNANSARPTSNYNLRMALALCVDAEGVLNSAFDGEGMVLNALAYPTYTDYQDEWDSTPYFEYNLDEAKSYLDKYLAETGTSANSLQLALMVQNGSEMSKVAQSIQAYVGALVGNPTCVEIISYDRGSYNSALADPSAYDMVLLAPQSATRAVCTYNWSYYWDLRKNEAEPCHSGDEKLQELLVEAAMSTTHSDATVAAFQQYLNDQCYVKALVCGDSYVVARSWISGLVNGKACGVKNGPNIGELEFDWANAG